MTEGTLPEPPLPAPLPERPLPEPWLRGSLTDVPAVPRAVLHSLQLAQEDLQKWCGDLSDEQLNKRPSGIASVAFHIRHIARSMDRLLTYAEGGQLAEEQLIALSNELGLPAGNSQLFAELAAACERSAQRIRALSTSNLDAARTVGKKRLPTTVAGLLVHIADHTQRHVGQAVTTCKIVTARGAQSG